MNAPEFILLLTIIRIVIPFGLLLFIGEWLRQRENRYWMKP